MWTIETAASYRDATHHIATCDSIEQLWVVVHAVWVADLLYPFYLTLELCLCLQVTYLVAMRIEVEQTIKTDALLGSHESAGWCIELQTTTGADSYQCQCGVLWFLGTGLEVDILERIQFVDHDVDVVASDTCALHGDALTLIGTRDGMELTAGYLALLLFEVRCNESDTTWVAHQNHFVSQLLWLEVKVEATSVFVYDQF